jgi:saccharopine dehydrogenase-like NADP-dependent oxidoreductase
MQHVFIAGAGKIGSLIAFLLTRCDDYFVTMADIEPASPALTKLGLKNFEFVTLNADKQDEVSAFLKKRPVKAVLSSLPYFCNVPLAKVAAEMQCNYFDLTEDVPTTAAVKEIAANSSSAFVPQCGLAPGFISIIANHLMQDYPELNSVKLRVGALPVNSSNALHYSLTWSTEGVINEYGNLCFAIKNGKEIPVLPLEGLEEIEIDGVTYEAFNTSGGIGSLAQTYAGKVKSLNYKTLRYPGHCAKMKFLMNDLKLNEDRTTLKTILERVIPKTKQDVVIVYVSVSGMHDEHLSEKSYFKKFYAQEIDGHTWSAIQLTTASSICAITDLVLHAPQKYTGFIRQEQFSLLDFTGNRFGKFFA